MYCNNCKSKLQKDSKYCHICGNKINNKVDINSDQLSFYDLTDDSSKNKINEIISDNLSFKEKFYRFLSTGETKIPKNIDKKIYIDDLLDFNNNDPIVTKEETLNIKTPGEDGVTQETIVYSKKTIESVQKTNEDSSFDKVDKKLDNDSNHDVKNDTQNRVWLRTKEFYNSVKSFFKPGCTFRINTEDIDNDNTINDGIEVTVFDRKTTEDTMPLTLSEDEIDILNKAYEKQNKKNKIKNSFRNINSKIVPHIRKALTMGARSRIPILIFSLLLSIVSVWFTLRIPTLYIPMGIIKIIVSFIIVSLATNAAFRSLKLKLGKSLESFFVIFQVFIYHLVDTVFIGLTFTQEPTTEAIIHVMSPNIFSFLVLIVLAIGLVLLNFQHINTDKTILPFVGSYLVVSMTLTGLIIMLESLVLSIFGSLIASYMI